MRQDSIHVRGSGELSRSLGAAPTKVPARHFFRAGVVRWPAQPLFASLADDRSHCVAAVAGDTVVRPLDREIHGKFNQSNATTCNTSKEAMAG
jgi:hypothetical protein